MTTRRPWIVTALWRVATRAVLHRGLGRRGRPRRQPFVLRAATAAPRPLRAVARMRVAVELDRRHAGPRVERPRAVDTSLLLLHPIQGRLDLHPAVRLRPRGCVSHPRGCQRRRGMRLSERRSRRVEAGAAVDAQHAPTAACNTRGRVSHSSHNASSFSCTRSTRRDYNRARTQGGINPTDSTTVATLRRVITFTGLGVHDAPESPFKLTGMRRWQ